MRFLSISSVFPPAFQYGGVPHTVLGVAKALITLGHKCQVITTNAGGDSHLSVPLDNVTSYDGVPVIYTSCWHQNPYFYAPKLIKQLKTLASHYDIALVRGGWGYINLAARLVLPKLALPYCLVPEGIFDPWAFHNNYYKKLFYWHLVERWNYFKASGIVALTDSEATFVRQRVPKVAVKVIPNGIDLNEFYQAPGQEEFNGFFPSLAGQFYILFLSRLHPKKGLDVLFPAFRLFLDECRRGDKSQPYLVVAGEGEEKYKDELTKISRHLGLEEHILFTGLVTGQAKLALLHHCAFMVLPSRSEGLPMAVLEAMACGKPVILTPQCYLPEVARSGAGLEVELDMRNWAVALAELWNNPYKFQVMGERALALVQEKFTWNKVAEEIVMFSQELLGQKR